MCPDAQATPAASDPLVLPRPFIAYAPPPPRLAWAHSPAVENQTPQNGKLAAQLRGPAVGTQKGGGAGEMDPVSTFLKCSVENRDSPRPRASVACCPRSSLLTLRPPSLALGGAVKLHPQGPHTYFR